MCCLTVVILVAVLCARLASDAVQFVADVPMRDRIVKELQRNSHFEAQALSAYFNNIEGTVQLMAEIVKDRISGYPEPGWEEDLYVPFLDRETSTNKYPLDSPDLVLDWDVTANVNESNADEHVQEVRKKWIGFAPASTASASYFMQGSCDPSETDETSSRYYENCTTANSNVRTGGVVKPTTTNYGLWKKGADIGLLLKPLYETQEEVVVMAVYFQNSGAGSFISFPGLVRDGQDTFTSHGCQWMNITNPRTNRTFGTQTEIDRCHGEGEVVNNREYNPLERFWYQEMAKRDTVTWFGPFYILEDEESLPLVIVGRSVFDRITGEIIGVVTVELILSDLEEFLEDHKFLEESDFTVVRISDDTVLADTIGGRRDLDQKVYETGIISEETYYWIKNQTLEEQEGFAICDSTTYAANLLPIPQANQTHYEPEFIVIQAISNKVFDVLDEMNQKVEDELLLTNILALSLGCFGALFVLGILYIVSQRVTEPLQWIDTVAFQIVNHAEQGSTRDFVAGRDESGSPETTRLASTTISGLVNEVKVMIQGFSGKGAAMVAHADMTEVRNLLTWQSDYQQLYTFNPKAEARHSIKRALAPENNSKNEDTAGTDPNGPPIRYIIPVEETPDQPEENCIGTIVPAPPKKNLGLNVVGDPKCPVDGGDRRGKDRSPLFWWILVLIGLPVVLTNVAICATVSYALLHSIPSLRDITEESVVYLLVDSLEQSAKLKSNEIGMAVRDVVRDTHFVSRVAGWLFFDGITRSDAFAHIEEATEECKAYNPDTIGSCPFYDDPERAVCVCSWEDFDLSDFEILSCRDYTPRKARELQRLFFLGQSRDADPVTGIRDNATSFGDGTNGVDVNSSTTQWWSDFDSVPGAEKGAAASGFDTTYDRIRVSSAISVALFPIFNYATELGKTKIVLNQALVRKICTQNFAYKFLGFRGRRGFYWLLWLQPRVSIGFLLRGVRREQSIEYQSCSVSRRKVRV